MLIKLRNLNLWMSNASAFKQIAYYYLSLIDYLFSQ